MKKKLKFKDDLKLDPGKAPIDLQAYRLAQRLFWYQAVHGGDETLQAIYERVLLIANQQHLFRLT